MFLTQKQKANRQTLASLCVIYGDTGRLGPSIDATETSICFGSMKTPVATALIERMVEDGVLMPQKKYAGTVTAQGGHVYTAPSTAYGASFTYSDKGPTLSLNARLHEHDGPGGKTGYSTLLVTGNAINQRRLDEMMGTIPAETTLQRLQDYRMADSANLGRLSQAFGTARTHPQDPDARRAVSVQAFHAGLVPTLGLLRATNLTQKATGLRLDLR
jgi:hypothetical protein